MMLIWRSVRRSICKDHNFKDHCTGKHKAATAAAKSLQSCPNLWDPRDGSPLGVPFPQDSPGKNTGVGCHFLLQCMKVKSESEVAQSCPTQRPHGLQPPRLLRPWDFPGKSTGVGCHCLLRGKRHTDIQSEAGVWMLMENVHHQHVNMCLLLKNINETSKSLISF